jgi:hypothetical protein
MFLGDMGPILASCPPQYHVNLANPGRHSPPLSHETIWQNGELQAKGLPVREEVHVFISMRPL